MNQIMQVFVTIRSKFDAIGGYLPQLGLRLFLAYEYGLSGIEKFNGTNWFADIQSDLLFPFNHVAPAISWQMATWFELLGPVALALGFATRFFSLSLIVLTVVAWAAVHAGNGYNVCDNGYKLPLMYLLMFIPLLFSGAGRASLDHFIWKRASK